METGIEEGYPLRLAEGVRRVPGVGGVRPARAEGARHTQRHTPAPNRARPGGLLRHRVQARDLQQLPLPEVH